MLNMSNNDSFEALRALTQEVLDQAYLMSLGVNDKQGVWVADVIFTYDDDANIYWMSTPERRHSVALR